MFNKNTTGIQTILHLQQQHYLLHFSSYFNNATLTNNYNAYQQKMKWHFERVITEYVQNTADYKTLEYIFILCDKKSWYV